MGWRNIQAVQNLKGLRPCRRPPKFWIFGLKNWDFWFRPIFKFGVKNGFFGVRDYHEWIRIEIWRHIQVSMPRIEFSEAITDQIKCFSTIFGLGWAVPGWAGPGRAGPSRAGPGRAGLGRARPGQRVCQPLPPNSVEFHRIPSNSVEFRRIPSNSIEFHRIPSNSVEFRRNRDGLDSPIYNNRTVGFP